MTVFYSNASLREIALGQVVNRVTAVPPTAAQSPQNLFTVTGGRILLVGIVGEVTTVIGGNAQTLALDYLSSTGGASAIHLASASGSIATYAVGVHFTLNTTAGGAVVDDHATGSGVVLPNVRYVLPAGNVTLTSSATNTGSIKWDLFYVPLDVGTAVVAA